MPEESRTTKQHAIPQQVFSVKYKLVGSLTVRQFVILALSGGLGVALFYSGLLGFFGIIIALILVLFGVAFAFVPIQELPLDEWITAFFRAIYAPTRRIWAKSLEPAEFLVLEIPKLARTAEPGLSAEESRRQLEIYLSTIHEGKELSSLDLAEKQYLDSIRTMAQKLVVAEVPAAPMPFARIAASTPALTLEEVLATPSAQAAPAEHPSLASTVNFTEPVYMVQRGHVSSYFAARRNVRVGRRLTPLAIAGAMVYAPAREQVLTTEPPSPLFPPEPPVAPVSLAPPVPPEPLATPVSPIPKRAAAKPITHPRAGENVIAGTVFDPQGEALAQTLLVVEDEKSNVVRAIKSNELGKFKTSPIPNGRYAVRVLKTAFPFATMEIELTGEKVPDLEIRPK